MLKRTLEAMDPKDAAMYMKQCIDSGLWVENVGGEEGDAPEDGEKIEELKTDDEKEAEEQTKQESPSKPSDVAAASNA